MNRMVMAGSVLCGALVLTGGAQLSSTQGPQTPEAVLGAAIHQDDAEGNLEAAIESYQTFLTRHGENRSLAVQALLRMGQAYERLGRPDARDAYERILRDYADQPEQVSAARARLSGLTDAASAADRSGLMVRRLESGFGIVGRVSPDGRYIGFRERGTGDLVLRDLSTGKNRRLMKSGGSLDQVDQSIFSPDGKQIVSAWDNFTEDIDELYIMGIDDSEARLLYRNSEIKGVAVMGWSPDGKDVLVRTELRDETFQIGFVSVEDGSLRVLKSLPWEGQGRTRIVRAPYPTLRLSPDGRYIAYTMRDGRDIFLLAADGSAEITLVEGPDRVKVLEWTPDGRSLLFRRTRMGSEDLWAIRVAGGKPQGLPQLITKNIGSISGRGMTATGSFHYSILGARQDVYVATLDPATGQVVVPPRPVSQNFLHLTHSPGWSPNGKYLAYIIGPYNYDISGGPRGIVIRHIDTGEERYFSADDLRGPVVWSNVLPSPAGMWWSPDGRSIVTRFSDEEGRFGLYQIDAETGNLTPIVRLRGELTPWGPVWSPDGKEIVYTINDGTEQHALLHPFAAPPHQLLTGSTRIVSRNLETGQETVLHRLDQGLLLGNLAISPDGRRVAFVTPQGGPTTLKVMSVTGGEAQELFSVQEPEYLPGQPHLAWTPDGEYLLFGRRAQRQGESNPRGPVTNRVRATMELWRISARGGTPQKLGEIEDPRGRLVVHPDGRQIAFNNTPRGARELWVMENLLAELTAATSDR